LRLKADSRSRCSNQFTPLWRDRAFDRAQTGNDVLLSRQLLAHHIGIAGMATKTLTQPVRQAIKLGRP
jgi:hypothetical protein